MAPLVPVVSALALAGCASPAAGEDPPAQLWDREFTAEQVTSADADTEALLSGVAFTVSFADGGIGAVADCNQIGGRVDPADGRLAVTELYHTEMACPDPAMAVDAWLVEFLESGPEYRLDGDSLTLTGADVTVTMVDRNA